MKKMTISLFAAAVILLLAIPADAKQKGDNPKQWKKHEKARKGQQAEMAEMMEVYKITKTLDLTTEDAQKFFPVYNQIKKAQRESRKEQMEHIVELLTPIKGKGLFMIAGNHESRTHRMVGLTPEQYMGIQLDVPYGGFSCLAVLQMESKTPNSFTCFFHHGAGGGFTPGGKVNSAVALRKIVPTADATFSGHSHTTSRIPFTWYDAGKTRVLKRVGYNYIIGSALEWNESYAEEKAKPSATIEHIKVQFKGCTSGKKDNRKQIYEVIVPRS